MADETVNSGSTSIELATELTIAWLSNPSVRASAEEVPVFLNTMHAKLEELSNNSASAAIEAAPEYVPAVPVRSSVKPDYLVSLIDGRKFKSLKRHLSTHGLTPQEYRERYGLKSDYPMVAANYSAHRREVAKTLGLGRKPGSGKGAAAAVPAATPRAAAKPAKAAAPKAKTAPTKAKRVAAKKPSAEAPAT